MNYRTVKIQPQIGDLNTAKIRRRSLVEKEMSCHAVTRTDGPEASLLGKPKGYLLLPPQSLIKYGEKLFALIFYFCKQTHIQ
jgi:hypothetical protein